ncbi:uncharacterized protein [Arachis hypogaea]|uniref:uncharacterized protein n=1 Tax=Arachis hypogaea TaxID=3818 RepID=UPI003B2243FF
MSGIDPQIISHKLAINSAVRPIQQKKQKLGEEKRRASLEETQKLINAEFIKEIRFTTWLANVVMVRKQNGYNQILMHPSDQDKTAFITDFGNYCYKVMPFGLKNAGATYQRLMDKVFAKQIGRNIEVYVDDMVAKTKIGHNQISDLTEIFGQIRQYNMHLNPEKCAFAVQGVTDWAISSALVSERNKVQHPIYFVSKTLQHAELNYPRIEKLALALIFSARRLRPYFQSHVIHIRTDHPLRQVGPIKSQFLADFIAELTIPSEEDHAKQWILYVDGSSNNGGCGAGIRLEAEDGFILEHSIHLAFKASNNQSEYEALLAGLRLCLDLHISTIKVYCDSLLVVQQVNGLFQIGGTTLYTIYKQVIYQKGPRTIKSSDGKHLPSQYSMGHCIDEDILAPYSNASTSQKLT